MDKYIFDESNGLWYERCGDYYLPCLSLPERKPVGIWGQRYLRFLKEHRSTTYTAMLLNGTLDDHVAEIDRQAEEMLDRLTKQMAQHEGVTEALKARNTEIALRPRSCHAHFFRVPVFSEPRISS